MSTAPEHTRIQALEARVARLAEFNELLLAHLLRIQNLSGPGKGPTSQQHVNVWLIDLSDAAWEKYRYNTKF